MVQWLTQARVVGKAPLYAIAAVSGVRSLHITSALKQLRQQLAQRRRCVETFLPAPIDQTQPPPPPPRAISTDGT